MIQMAVYTNQRKIKSMMLDPEFEDVKYYKKPSDRLVGEVGRIAHVLIINAFEGMILNPDIKEIKQTGGVGEGRRGYNNPGVQVLSFGKRKKKTQV